MKSKVEMPALIAGIRLPSTRDYITIRPMTAEFFGVQAPGRLLGVILTLTVDGLAEAIAPRWHERMLDRPGRYSGVLVTLIAAASQAALRVVPLPKRGAQPG